MNVLVIGSGGREHTIAWKVAQSSRLRNLFMAPGNGGTCQHGENVMLEVADHAEVILCCKEKGIDLVIVGPEVPLAEGLSDSLLAAGFNVFGPTRAAAQIEASKAFAKSFMARHAIQTARFASFDNFRSAVEHLDMVDYPIVIKASGLAAGKGVILPESRVEAIQALEGMLFGKEFGEAGSEVIIEERLQGQEVSLMAFTDGITVKPMPPAQDHKRLLDGDRGPNTGGMGAYAPAPVLSPAMVEEITRSIIQPTVDGLRDDGRVFKGILFAGLILTENGPQVLEFNCRFGDPETQAVLPLLDSDLLEIIEACTNGTLAETKISWRSCSAVCVVLASANYPAKPELGKVVSGLKGNLPENVLFFHAGTKSENGKVITTGGRVIGVTAWDETLAGAVEGAYRAVEQISFDGMQYRRDIARRVLGEKK